MTLTMKIFRKRHSRSNSTYQVEGKENKTNYLGINLPKVTKDMHSKSIRC